jgi:hypothetical protein
MIYCRCIGVISDNKKLADRVADSIKELFPNVSNVVTSREEAFEISDAVAIRIRIIRVAKVRRFRPKEGRMIITRALIEDTFLKPGELVNYECFKWRLPQMKEWKPITIDTTKFKVLS